MGRQVRLNHEVAMTDADILKALHCAAEKYGQYAGKKVLYIFRANKKNAPYEDYEVYFGKENFIHLVGFKRWKIKAVEFYEKCLTGEYEIGEALLKENRKAASTKLDTLPLLLEYRHAKIYKMGNVDLLSEKNKFEVGIGNQTGIMGFDHRVPAPALAVPTTVMKRALTDYVSTPQNILAIFVKDEHDKYYKDVVWCISRGIEMEQIPEYIRKKIEPTLQKIER